MMSQESNVILIDEFDKVNPSFYNAFYELFDGGRYVDTNYDVNLGQTIFLLTYNFRSEDEIKKILGPAMFSRNGVLCKIVGNIHLAVVQERGQVRFLILGIGHRLGQPAAGNRVQGF